MPVSLCVKIDAFLLCDFGSKANREYIALWALLETVVCTLIWEISNLPKLIINGLVCQKIHKSGKSRAFEMSKLLFLASRGVKSAVIGKI